MITQFICKTVDVHRSRIVELVLSASDALDLESRSVTEVLGCAKLSNALCTVNSDKPARSTVTRSFVRVIQLSRNCDFITSHFAKHCVSFPRLSLSATTFRVF